MLWGEGHWVRPGRLSHMFFTPDQVQQLSVPAHKNRKDKKNDKADKEKGDKLVDPSSVTVI